ncbi:MAG: acyltransferase family protein, partial [Acidimicrobiales bacterium]
MTSTSPGELSPGPARADAEFVPLSRRRFPALEGLRGLAAIGVLIQHLGFWTGATFNTRAGGLLARLDWGVPVFFAISGFLLFRAPAEALLDPDEVRPFSDLKKFWRRRIWRVFPAYLAVFAIVMIVPRHITAKPSMLEMPLHVLLLQIYPTDTFAEGISQAWSLSVEISFYLLLPFFGRA